MEIDDVMSLGAFSSEGPVKTDVLTSEKFNVAIVRLEAGQEIPPHPEPYAVFFLVLEGEGVFTSRGGSFVLRKDSGIFIEGGEVRGIRCVEPMTILAVQDGHQTS